MIAGPSGCSLAISWVGFCSGCWVEEPPAAWHSAGALAQRIRTTAAENSRCHMRLTFPLHRFDTTSGDATADGPARYIVCDGNANWVPAAATMSVTPNN